MRLRARGIAMAIVGGTVLLSLSLLIVIVSSPNRFTAQTNTCFLYCTPPAVLDSSRCTCVGGSSSSRCPIVPSCSPPVSPCYISGPAPTDANGCRIGCAPVTCTSSSRAACGPPPDCSMPPPPCYRKPPVLNASGCMVSCGAIDCSSNTFCPCNQGFSTCVSCNTNKGYSFTDASNACASACGTQVSSSSVRCPVVPYCAAPRSPCYISGPVPMDENGCRTGCAPITCSSSSAPAVRCDLYCPPPSYLDPNASCRCIGGSSSSSHLCLTLVCAQPPSGCHYGPPTYDAYGCQNSCGTIICSSSSAQKCNNVVCSPPSGCQYVNPLYGNGCKVSCGTLVCSSSSAAPATCTACNAAACQECGMRERLCGAWQGGGYECLAGPLNGYTICSCPAASSSSIRTATCTALNQVVPTGGSCCTGLSAVYRDMMTPNVQGVCTPSSNMFVCTYCGNGTCDTLENHCNCPADCHASSASSASSADALPVTANADLSVTITGPSSMIKGTDAFFAVTVSNAGPSSTTASLTFNPSTSLVSSGGTPVTQTFPLASGENRTITYQYTTQTWTSCSAVVQLSATVQSIGVLDPNSGNNTAGLYVPITCVSSSSSAADNPTDTWIDCPSGYSCTKQLSGSFCSGIPLFCTPQYSGTCGNTACQGQCGRCVTVLSSSSSSSSSYVYVPPAPANSSSSVKTAGWPLPPSSSSASGEINMCAAPLCTSFCRTLSSGQRSCKKICERAPSFTSINATLCPTGQYLSSFTCNLSDPQGCVYQCSALPSS